MATPNHTNFDANRLVYSTTSIPRQGGGRYARIGYDNLQNQVRVQLGESPRDACRAPFGIDFAVKDDPTSCKQVKLELTQEKKAFFEGFEAETVAAAEANSQGWFGRPKPNAMHNSLIKSQNGDRPDVVQIKISEGRNGPKTTVEVTICQNGQFTTPKEGSIDDITENVSVLALIRVQGGVYLMNKSYGTSLVADHILVVKDGGASSGLKRKIDYGDFKFIDNPCEDDEE